MRNALAPKRRRRRLENGNSKPETGETRLVRLEAERARQERQLRSLLDAAQAGVSSLALREVLQRVLAAVRGLFGASGAAVWRIDEAGVLRRFGSVGLSEDYIRTATSAGSGDGVTDLVIRSGEPVAVHDVGSDRRLDPDSERAPLAAEGLRSFLSAPLFSRGRANGALSVYRRDAYQFGQAEVQLLAGLANVVAASIENALLHARTERALAEVSAQQELLRRIVETAQDGILALDAQGRILLFSPGCERLTGWSAGQAEGQLVRDVLPIDESRSEPAASASAGRPIQSLSGRPAEPPAYTELPLQTRDGDGSSAVRWVGVSFARVPGRRPGRVRAVMVLRDITAAKEMDELKSTLLSTMSHELRTPLTSIRALSELLVEHDFEASEGRQVAATINRESERLTRLVDNVLDAARIEAGQLPTHPQPIRLLPVVREAIGVLERPARARFQVDLPADLPPVMADRDRLRQILDNLLSNAVKYGKPGAEVKVRARSDTDRVSVSVIDRGPGIPPEHLPHLFDRFHRVRTGVEPGGTGLGLFITNSLVEMMGGQLEVTSRPGRGSTFSFTLPLAP
jgi:two-component system, OmpR family, phosphate regulon sensor histidine kinase PhoR